ncbi:MAG: spore photoproduct lyase [Firmicutes bacterium]|nr:spore photoproduct lyase [Bacillota bacterium]
MKLFQPKRVYFEEAALNYPLGVKILEQMAVEGVPVRMVGSSNRISGIPGATPQESYREGKNTLVVGVKRGLKLATCKPSSDFEFSLATGCPGGCQYCYLQTHLGQKPYIRIHVNIEEILDQVLKITAKNHPRITTFEAASASDPLAVEHLTGSLARAISFFGSLESARLRAVTKFPNIDSLLNLDHQGRTRFRFSLNTASIINRYEFNTATLPERINAAQKMSQAGYPVGFIIAPIFIYPDYLKEYEALFQQLESALKPAPSGLTFEYITHRFTASAKKVILERFPNSDLDLNETTRKKRYGKYGLVKYIYPDPDYQRLKTEMLQLAARYFPQAKVEYFT